MTPTIEQQTGWRRPHPATICPDSRMLLKVEEYSYDLEDEAFLAYFHDRTGYRIKDIPKYELTMWLLRADTAAAAEEFILHSPDFRLAAKPGETYASAERRILNSPAYFRGTGPDGAPVIVGDPAPPVPPGQRKSFLTYIRTTRGKLQDCWEVFKAVGRDAH